MKLYKNCFNHPVIRHLTDDTPPLKGGEMNVINVFALGLLKKSFKTAKYAKKAQSAQSLTVNN